jgi:hypothetical protein
MFTKIFDALLALVFTGMTVFGAGELYNAVRREALKRVSKGLSSTYLFTQKLTGEHFDWEQ